MKQVLITVLLQCSLLVTGFSQARGGNPKFDADANPYEKIVKESDQGKRTAKFFQNFIQPPVLRDYFDASPCNEYVNLSNTRIEQFTDFVDAIIKGGIDAKQMTKAANDFKKRGIATQIADIDYHTGYIEKQGTFTTDNKVPVENLLCRAKGSLGAIKSIVAYLEAVKRLFPSIDDIDMAIQKGKSTIHAYPDNKSLLDKIKQNLNQ
nr:hypothetical protein [uncultured Sediminibacterium sp.]